MLSLDPMARTMHPAAATLGHNSHHHRRLVSSSFVVSPPAILHASWITALVAVCLALCAIHSRRPPSASSSSSSKAARSASGGCRSASTRRHSGQGDEGSNGGGGGGSSTAAATPPAKVSPTPSNVGETQAAAAPAEGHGVDDHALQDGAGAGAAPVTVIDVGTHGPIAPVFPAAPDRLPPRRSLSLKHMRLAERFGARIRSTRWGREDHDHDDEDEDAGGGGEPAAEGSTLWTKTIILGECCRVGDDEDGEAVTRWKSYRPRQPRSVPMTRGNSFAGVGSRPAADVPIYLGRRASLPTKDET